VLSPDREQVILSKDKRNNTNYCVAGRGNLRKLVLIGSCVAFKRHRSKQQGWGDEPRSYPLQSRVLEQSAPCPQMGSSAYEVRVPTYALLPQLAESYDRNRAGEDSVPSPTFLPKREGIISPTSATLPMSLLPYLQEERM